MLIQSTGWLSKIQLMKTIAVSIMQTIDVTWALVLTFFMLISFWLVLRFSAAILFVAGLTRLELEWIDISIYVRWDNNEWYLYTYRQELQPYLPIHRFEYLKVQKYFKNINWIQERWNSQYPANDSLYNIEDITKESRFQIVVLAMVKKW